MKLLIKLTAFFTLIFSVYMIHEYYELHQPQKTAALKRIDPLPETMRLIDAKKYAQASAYLGFFMQFDYVKNNPKARRLYEALEQKRHSMAYQAKKVAEGVWEGKSDETIGKISAGISDFFLWGDLRDLSIEGYHYLKGEKVDKVLVGLSSIGVAASVATFASEGGIAPVKSGVSALKFIKKSGKMPLWLEKFIVRSASKVRKSGDLKPVKAFFDDFSTVMRAGGIGTTTTLLRTAPSLKAFHNSVGFAKMFGKESGVLVKILGNDAPVYYRLLKNNVSKKGFLEAATYGTKGIRTLAKVGEKRFLKMLKPAVKTSRLTKVFSKHIVDALHRIPVAVYILLAAVSLLFLI